MAEWVLLLGGSTGHGAATAKQLAKDGYGIIAFHFDRGEAKKIAEKPSLKLMKLPKAIVIILIVMLHRKK